MFHEGFHTEKKMCDSQSLDLSGFQAFRLSGFQVFRFLGFQVCRFLEFLGNAYADFLILIWEFDIGSGILIQISGSGVINMKTRH